jgi:S-formylglutathione hydrolase FrmB
MKMAFCELHYRSNALEKSISADVILPENQSGPFYTLYLLHGLSDDHTIWQRKTSIERYVEGLPLIVVMPDSGRGFYTDAQAGMAWETSIIRDLVGYVDTMFHTIPERKGRCLAGLSMGGYGAMKFGLKYPGMFSSTASHSGALSWGHYPLTDDEKYSQEFKMVIGEHPEGGPNDLYSLAAACPPETRPAIRIDCGKEDFLIERNREFHEYLLKIGIQHEYAEFPGEHTWEYWDAHIQETIAFHRKSLGI